MNAIELRGLALRAGGRPILLSLDLDVPQGEFFVVLGPSGAGKTTLLSLLAGLRRPSTGSVKLWGNDAVLVPPHERGLAMVFQEPALYPHLTASQNLAFPLRARKFPTREIISRVPNLASRLGLSSFLDRLPEALSGGEKQRLALGKALIWGPRILLLDEPFTDLDPPARASLQADLLRFHHELGLTTLMVTHDQAEAMALGDRLAVMRQGEFVQVGHPREIYDRPASPFVARFLGTPPMNLIRVRLNRDGERFQLIGPGRLGCEWSSRQTGLDSLELPRAPADLELGLRPEHIRLGQANDGLIPFGAAKVLRCEPQGHEQIVSLEAGQQTLLVRVGPHQTIAIGKEEALRLNFQKACWFEISRDST